jgi:hypothetical protein
MSPEACGARPLLTPQALRPGTVQALRPHLLLVPRLRVEAVVIQRLVLPVVPVVVGPQVDPAVVRPLVLAVVVGPPVIPAVILWLYRRCRRHDRPLLHLNFFLVLLVLVYLDLHLLGLHLPAVRQVLDRPQ